MKKLNKFLIASFAIGMITSCVNDDTVFTQSNKSAVTIEGQSARTVLEGETITVDLAVANPYKEPIDLKLQLISGGQDADYAVVDSEGEVVGATSVEDGLGDFGYEIQIPAYATSHSFTIRATRDVLAESTENLVFQLRNSRNGNGLVTGDNKINLEVENFVSDELGLILDWDTDVFYRVLRRKVLETDADDEVLEKEDHLCDLVDLDVFVSGGAASAFTGACPEVVDTLNNTTSVLADGAYGVFVDAWTITPDLDADENDVLASSFTIPFTLTISHIGTFNTTLTIPDFYNSGSEVSDGGGNGTKLAAIIRVNNGKYSVYNALDELVAQEQ